MLRPATLSWSILLLMPLAVVTAPAARAVDAEAERAAIHEADRAFAAALAGRNRMRFQWFLDPDAVFLGDGVFGGPGAIVEAWGVFFEAGSGASIGWQPTDIHVAASGELAYAVGDTEVRMPGAEGGPTVQSGRFLTLWRKDATGAWKVLATGALVVSLDPILGPIRDRLAALAEVWPPMRPLRAETTVVATPERVETSAAGDLAATVGRYRVEARHGGETSHAEGGYLRLWKNDGDGVWRAVAEALSPPR